MSSTPTPGVATKVHVNGSTHPAPIPPPSSSSPSASPVPGINGISGTQLAQLDPELRSSINSALLHNGGITRIHAQLLDNLQRTGWTAAIHTRCLELLRSGECTTYDRLMKRILAEVAATGGGSGSNGSSSGGGSFSSDDAKARTNGVGAGHKAGSNAKNTSPNVRVPENVIQDGVRLVKKELEDIAEVTVE
ncbi:hypothetical protein L228DRAFT_235953 [Xylona heveae TC161]|uniref:Uncharacterized protein n=1 Tax=Xylona heveae (strain CBS 132557 / TC161) TaxID=1328760 RepID=A0A165K3P7_XYLHT|nr:hypothetical protein L228DRAFT_235953 [Xylona heveae TC161]KZF26949.1 hypothetical protein L228DRAFT_235953 [Xylona heveae TC161]